jgi:signal transduction histidine kinase
VADHDRCDAHRVLVASARRRLPVIAAAVTLATFVAAVAVVAALDHRFSQLGRRDLHQMGGPGLVFLVASASACLVGAVLLVRRPEHPVGWCFAFLGLSVAASGAAQSYGLLGLVADPHGDHPGAASAAVLASSLFVLWLITIGLVCHLTPTGHYLCSRWAWCARALWIVGLLWFVTVLISPTVLEAPFSDVENPWGIEALRDSPLIPVRSVAGVITGLLVLVAFASLVVRFRRSSGEERRQLLWMGIAAVPVPVLVVVTFIAAKTDNDVVLNLASGGFVAVLPLAAGLAVAKTRLYDVDRILSQAISYLLLTAVLAGTYAGVVLLLGQGVGGVAGSSTIAVAVATLAVAVLARPAHRTLQDTVDRRFSRRRYDALQMIRAHVATPDPTTTVEQVLRDALRDQDLAVSYWVPDKAVWVTGAGLPAVVPSRALTVRRGGRPVARVSSVTLEAELVDAVLREAEPELDNAGLRAAVALQLEDVRASRQRLATAQLDERRRVERDLHDGAQQRLLALAAQFQAALVNGAPERLREALRMGVEQSQTAVRELRELANGLHPSMLADGGLAAALDDLASRHRVQIDVAEPGQRYSPRIEATAWFIACEAVTNAVKHAAAERVRVLVERDGCELLVVIEDDGLGGADPSGSGLRGLADRAEAVGGHLAVLAREPHGTTVRAVLPCGS